jgi:hypothetical protein
VREGQVVGQVVQGKAADFADLVPVRVRLPGFDFTCVDHQHDWFAAL